MPFEKENLMEFLKHVNSELKKEIKIIAVGGTAMTLLGLKSSTIDIDFDLSTDDAEELKKALKIIPHGFRIDIFKDGMIFSQQLPNDYSEKSIPIKTDFRNIMLFALHPVDIIVTKIGRLNKRDEEDINACIKKFRLTKQEIEKRAGQVEYIGRKENYEINLTYVLKNFF